MEIWQGNISNTQDIKTVVQSLKSDPKQLVGTIRIISSAIELSFKLSKET